MEFREIVGTGNLAVWQVLTEKIAAGNEIKILQKPETCMTMLAAVDSVGHTPFYAGEVLMTEAAVSIGKMIGYGFVLENEPVRALCMAIIDAALQAHVEEEAEIRQKLADEEKCISELHQREQEMIAATKVRFAVMEG
ncbi:phosphonate C-P lyase system protein PhnG [Pectinatus haikarae]|uniref:Alpha-D-ribose 1-methylphosphonate 5-triphosphate synthase subunit PhnG n=1 Tax=Pectinatus haikarae TaxID=349096 RepID=A0ABT9Y9X0_9FIRM|nr:phosphonate C-P lyase system protein PhnG [Pectinatus haikarae]MDQ0204637.1 alpha-D-ribose 1-methylphosphonate 5-triphosphate synthase subunit PhnG [Pectinatus haikarae]